ncbi:hypothetical protein DENIS_3728 [Desulfonema ishimotonii]|uniref:Uncharacterized protein n=1 Tax=Desulfonema ishimotonii TaxID=45657 RepID=A0A401G0L2_9BACT|nr:tetratricopeptide repeat protein [Desulfonema ishimotonii]GBC62751.1 hypothetical protein DENIS_3728 [Desulfonema ishimotonii]
MTAELILSFPNANQVMVEFAGERTSALDFKEPIIDEDPDEIRWHDEIRWYIEVYGTQYTIDIDDGRAERIVEKFKPWGEALFNAACPVSSLKARDIFLKFYRASRQNGGLITIDTAIPDILSLPWELLCVENKSIIHRNPHITIRRKLSGAEGIDEPFRPEAKEKLRLLFVVSRPTGAGFIDPRADARAVMDALDENAPGRVDVEFLRPATLDNLTKRLRRQGPQHRGKPAVDILHFDGHGVFDTHGAMIRKAMKSDPSAATRDAGTDLKPDTGYLLFEDEKGKEALITAETLGEMLTNQKVALTVLSACQSGAVGQQKAGEDENGKGRAINGVAARLTQAGLPGVIAMSHTVLVETTRRLFGQFYARLGDHMGVGAALDEARQYLYAHPDRGERRRGEHDRVTLRLYDWFLPALYQSGADISLLPDGFEDGGVMAQIPDAEDKSNLPQPPQTGFQGRSVELWGIERAFLDGTRRITVTGFGGQGKTELAAEAGRWLVRSGMFQKCCFVSFAAFQGADPVGSGVLPALRTALEDSLTHEGDDLRALAATPTLLILDNLESLRDETGDRQTALLDAAARWSRAGGSRVLITTRQGRLEHPDFPAAQDREHQYLPLSGLAEHDAVAYFSALWELPPAPAAHIEPPKRHGLVALFKQVDFHPLSVGLLAYQLKSRRVSELGERLESLLAEAPGDGADKNLRVSLDLSLERLSPEARKWLPGLGVFHGGAMEDVLLQVTGLGEVDEAPEVAKGRQLLEAWKSGDPTALFHAAGTALPNGVELPKELMAQIIEKMEKDFEEIEVRLYNQKRPEFTEGADESTWPELRGALEAAGLIRAERLPGVAAPFLKFHPALAPALWEGLPHEEKENLAARHRAAYYRLSDRLYSQDEKDPFAARAVAMNELPNLLFAVRAALKAEEKSAVSFVNHVNRFLDCFGLLRDRNDLNWRVGTIAKSGSWEWYMAQSNKGRALLDAGRHAEAEAVFRDILTTLGETPTYERRHTLLMLGRCLRFSGRTAQAVAVYREGVILSEKLEQSDSVRRQTSILQTDLADALTDMGDFPDARATYEAALGIAKDQGDDRQIGVVQGQLGTLSMLEDNLAEAGRHYREVLQISRRLGEPGMEAAAQHQLGKVYGKAEQWDAAETAYRESARLFGYLGDIPKEAATYNNLGNTMENAGRTAEAETWFRRSMDCSKKAGNREHANKAMSNLAKLLLNDTAHLDDIRLAEARNLAEQALALMKTLDPGVSEIWKNYNILAQIADKQGKAAQAREYRRLGREELMAFPGTQHQLKFLLPTVKLIVDAVNGNSESRKMMETRISIFKELSAENQEMLQLFEGMEKILNGEREIANIDDLNPNFAVALQQVLEAVENPEAFNALLEAAVQPTIT